MIGTVGPTRQVLHLTVLAMVAVLSVACGQSSPDAPVETVADRVPFESMRPVLHRGGDWFLSLDAVGSDEPGDGQQLGYVAAADGLSEATVVDLSLLGPRFGLQVGWSGEEFILVGLRCPEPWIAADHPDDDSSYDSNLGSCGSTISDAFALDPVSGELRTLVGDVDGGFDERLSFQAATPDATLLGWHGGQSDWLLVTDRGIERIPALDRALEVCPVDGSFVAASRVPIDGGQANPAIPITDFYDLFRLVDGTWQPEAMPPLELLVHWSRVEGCSSHGFLFSGTYDEGEDLAGLGWLGGTADGPLSWSPLHLDEIPLEPGQRLTLGLIDGTVFATPLWRPDPAHPAGSDAAFEQTYLWDGTAWQRYGPEAATVAAVLGDGSALIAWNEDGSMKIIRPLSGDTAPVSVSS